MGAIQRLLGHESRRTTEIYLHSHGQNERDAMKMLDEAVVGAEAGLKACNEKEVTCEPEKSTHKSHTEQKKDLSMTA